MLQKKKKTPTTLSLTIFAFPIDVVTGLIRLISNKKSINKSKQFYSNLKTSLFSAR